MKSFYDIRATTVLSSLAIDALTTYVPFRLLRPLSPAHASSTSSSALAVLNQPIITDLTIQTLTTILAATIYSVTLFGAFSSFLPVTLVTYFDGIPTISAAHSASVITLLPLSLVLGLAARSFIFTPAAAAAPSPTTAKASHFNPATASLWETVVWNVWGYDERTKVIIKRTAALCIASGVNTFVQCYFTVEGVEVIGATVYSAVWVLAAAVTGTALGVVGSV